MIERTKAMIEEDKKRSFIATKGFQDAKEKIRKNQVVVIKGNTGDGKTTTAIRLILWLIEEQQGRQPLQLHNIKDLDSLPPKSKLITFIDDIFGEKVAHEKDVGEWNKRIKSVLPTPCGDKPTEANFLLITIRNEVFNSLRGHSSENVIVDSNIIDLSSDDYKIKGEKLEFLELYKPEKDEFSWKGNEKEEIVKYATGIGFPQCCRLFRDISDLQKERVDFFKKPFYFLNRVLSKLEECNAILFLFLNNGEIDVKDLDPNGEKVNKTLLEKAFNIDLRGMWDNRLPMNDEQKIEFVRKSLDTLSGFLVVKKKKWSGEGFLYRFAHDSIHTTVALLYGEKTPIGYVKYCPVDSLGLVTTSISSPDRIMLSPDNYVYMFERIHREWETSSDDDCGTVGSLDVWTDRQFMERFVRWLNDKEIDKVSVLNKACLHGADSCALYLLSHGVIPDKDTDWFSLITEGKHDEEWYFRDFDDTDMGVLKKVFIYMNVEMKLGLLNKVCSDGNVECALYLLSEGVEPDKDTDWFSLIRKDNLDVPVWHVRDDTDMAVVLKKVFTYMNVEMKNGLLNKVCESHGFHESGIYLLSQGFKPDKDTKWWSLITNGWEVDFTDYIGVLEEVVVYMDDEIKLYVLNEACCSGSDKCVKYLLSEDVECEENTPFCVVKTRNINMLRNIISVINDEIKLFLLNVTCYTGLEECSLYLLSEGVKPDKDTLFCVVRKGSVNVLCKLLQYDVIPIVRVNLSKSSYNVLHDACRCEREEMVTMLCNTYPELVLMDGDNTLLLAAETGNCGIFHTVEGVILKSLYRVEDERHQCESVDGRVVHRNCVCSQYMSQLVDLNGDTVLNMICERGHMTLCVYMCQSYPELARVVDKDGRTALHMSCGSGHIKICKDLCQSYPELARVVDKDERTVLHMSCGSGHIEICKYLCQSYPELATAVDKNGLHCLHYTANGSLHQYYINFTFDWFTECEVYVKQHLESLGLEYDITTIRDNSGESVSDLRSRILKEMF